MTSTRLGLVTRHVLWTAAAFGVGSLGFVALAAAGNGCHHCGCCDKVKKVCRVVCEMKEVKEPVYEVICEDFCLQGKSCKIPGCEKCCHCGGSGCVHCMRPTCGRVKSRMKLVKKEEVKKVPTYKCVVEYLCPSCSARCAACESTTK